MGFLKIKGLMISRDKTPRRHKIKTRLARIKRNENPDLPHEILVEIFSRIPTKSVGKCRTLSKSWNTHLSTPNFINKHLTFRKQTIQQENLVLTTQFDQLCIITSPTKNDEVFNEKSGSGKWRCVFGSCNGLVLINGSQGLILMNPITLKQVNIPPLLAERKDLEYCGCVCGLGYDSCTDDYKIVEISSFKPRNGVGGAYVDVYSVKNGVWKSLHDGCYPYGGLGPKTYAFEGGAYVNGALHWLVCSKEGYRGCIAVFDLATEVFSEMPLPKEFVRQPGSVVECFSNMGFNMPRTNGVSVVGGCLLIVDNLGNGVTEVWIMKEYGVDESWVKFRIQAEDGNWYNIAAMLCYVEGELLFLTSWDFLFACDLKSGTMRKVVLGESDCWYKHGMAFVDSLVSPEWIFV